MHRCVLVQDAHTPGEQVVLATLYRLSKNNRWGRIEPDGSALVSVSLKELAEQTRMHETNVRVNLRNLLDKLAIELVAKEDRRQQSARRYRVFNFRQILERRRAAGLEWVVKARGITFVPTSQAMELLASDSLPTDYLDFYQTLPSEGISARASESLETLPSASLDASLLVNRALENSPRQTPTTSAASSNSYPVQPQIHKSEADPQIVELVRKYGLDPDDEILRRLVDAASKRAVESTGTAATIDEILYFTEQKLKALEMTSGVRNPLAFLASVVPKCFEGESFRHYRQEIEREKLRVQQRLLEQKAELEQWRRQQEAILADPAASEEDKLWARQSLGLDSEAGGAGN